MSPRADNHSHCSCWGAVMTRCRHEASSGTRRCMPRSLSSMSDVACASALLSWSGNSTVPKDKKLRDTGTSGGREAESVAKHFQHPQPLCVLEDIAQKRRALYSGPVALQLMAAVQQQLLEPAQAGCSICHAAHPTFPAGVAVLQP